MVFFWIGFAAVVLAYSYLALLFLRQKVKTLKSKEDIFHFLGGEVYSGSAKLHVLAGEANISIYDKLCEDIEKNLKNNPNAQATFIFGPELSYWNTQESYLTKEKHLSSECSDAIALHMHPLFELSEKYPKNVQLFFKTNVNTEKHFAVGDDFIYVEKHHKPLEESSAMFIEHPNWMLKAKYKQKVKESLAIRGLLRITTVDDIRSKVKFGHPVDPNLSVF